MLLRSDFAPSYPWRIELYITVETFYVEPHHRLEFEKIWSLWTMESKCVLKSIGARLHRANANKYVSYTQWPDEATWRRSQKMTLLSQRYLEQLSLLIDSVNSWEVVEDCLPSSRSKLSITENWPLQACALTTV